MFKPEEGKIDKRHGDPEAGGKTSGQKVHLSPGHDNARSLMGLLVVQQVHVSTPASCIGSPTEAPLMSSLYMGGVTAGC